MKIRTMAAALSVAGLTLGLAACSGESDPNGSTTSPGGTAEPGEISGDITVLTNRTDIVDTVFQDYKAQFEEIYPDVNVSFEAITDYEGEVTTRMNTTDYGDVLLIPNSVIPSDLPDFFEPLGSITDLYETYRYVATEMNYDGQVYGIAVVGNANGIVYHKPLWEDAGYSDFPTTPEEFLEGLQAIKDTSDAIPLYTNYADGWPLTIWGSQTGTVTANPEYLNELAHTDSPWVEGSDYFVIDSLLYDAVERGLTEPDPTTTDWEQSKVEIGNGRVGAMVLGSWAIVQMQDAAEEAGFDRDDIGFMPFPTQVDGQFYSRSEGDYKNGINVHSQNKEAARAWIEWFNAESGFSQDQGGISPRFDGAAPDTLVDFEEAGVRFLELNPAPAEEVGLFQEIDRASEIGLTSEQYLQRIVDAARGARSETKEEIFADLNAKWAAGRAAIQGD